MVLPRPARGPSRRRARVGAEARAAGARVQEVEAPRRPGQGDHLREVRGPGRPFAAVGKVLPHDGPAPRQHLPVPNPAPISVEGGTEM